MPDEARPRDIEAEHRRLVGAPLDPDVLTTVIEGTDPLGTWELRDGPHPLPQDPDAVRHELITRHGRHGLGISGGIAPRLRPGQIALIGTEAHGHRDRERGWISIGYILVRCQPSVATVRRSYPDGETSETSTALSGTTGERWAVCPLERTGLASQLELFDEAGTVLERHHVADPRTRPKQE